MIAADGRGRLMAAEMAAQPRILRALGDRRGEVAHLLRGVLPARLAGTVLVGRGSSDYAAVYGRYLLEYASGRPVALAAPSLHTRYRIHADLEGWLAIAVSQSGSTPEIGATLRRMAAAGAATVAVTNEEGSALAAAAEATLLLGAGEERAVPATKTFTAQLAAFALFAGAFAEATWDAGGWGRMVEAVGAVLADPAPARHTAERIAATEQVITVARGFLYATALETALKVAETTGMIAAGYSPADLQHGPIAAAGPGLHAVCFSVEGPVAEDVARVAAALAERGVTVHAVADTASRVAAAEGHLPVPADVPEVLAPVVHAVRGQQLARELALIRGVDPDQPHGLRKVTPTT